MVADISDSTTDLQKHSEMYNGYIGAHMRSGTQLLGSHVSRSVAPEGQTADLSWDAHCIQRVLSQTLSLTHTHAYMYLHSTLLGKFMKKICIKKQLHWTLNITEKHSSCSADQSINDTRIHTARPKGYVWVRLESGLRAAAGSSHSHPADVHLWATSRSQWFGECEENTSTQKKYS